MKAKIIAIANRKGGVAKTTTVSSLSGICAARNYRVLIIDLDPQANLSSNYLKDEPDETITDTFFNKTLTIVNIKKNLDLIPADKALSQVESNMDRKEDQYILKDVLKRVEDKYDFIFLDCPPALG